MSYRYTSIVGTLRRPAQSLVGASNSTSTSVPSVASRSMSSRSARSTSWITVLLCGQAGESRHGARDSLRGTPGCPKGHPSAVRPATPVRRRPAAPSAAFGCVSSPRIRRMNRCVANRPAMGQICRITVHSTGHSPSASSPALSVAPAGPTSERANRAARHRPPAWSGRTACARTDVEEPRPYRLDADAGHLVAHRPDLALELRDVGRRRP